MRGGAYLGICVGIILCGSGIILIVSNLSRDKVLAEIKLQQNNEWIEKTYLTRSGWDQKHGHFDLLSLDQGRTWYEKKTNPDGTVTLIGANEIGHQQMGLERLTNYVRAHGSVDPNTPEGKKMLEDAGFTVTEKEKSKQ